MAGGIVWRYRTASPRRRDCKLSRAGGQRTDRLGIDFAEGFPRDYEHNSVIAARLAIMRGAGARVNKYPQSALSAQVFTKNLQEAALDARSDTRTCASG